VTKGTPPQFAEEQIVPPKAPPLEAPKIHIEPTIEVQPDVKMASTVPQIGVPNSPLVGLSVGVGTGTGIGSGNGPGMGPGWGGNMGGGPRMVGGGVSAPVVVYSVEPEFSEEARRAKFSGNVLVSLWVDEKGIPSHVHVVHSVGMGLDEKAVLVGSMKSEPDMNVLVALRSIEKYLAQQEIEVALGQVHNATKSSQCCSGKRRCPGRRFFVCPRFEFRTLALPNPRKISANGE
jgi:hypothetical protein